MNLSIPCNVCDASDAEEIRSKDRHGNPLRSVICRHCGLVWTDPRLSPEEVRQFYGQLYRSEYKGAYEPRPRHQYRNAKVAIERVERLKGFVQRGSRVFDVGAGSGEVVYVLRAIGCEASGVEPNEAYARYAADVLKVPVTRGFFQEAPVAPESVDAVTMFHTVEHLENPLEAMRAAHKWLRPGGLLVVEVPNVEAVCQSPHRQFHRGHLYHFNLTTLQAVARRAGYGVIQTSVSPDGGNIAIAATKIAQSDPSPDDLRGNYVRVRDILQRHTPLRHALSRHPLIRPLRKVAARLDEYLHMRGTRSPAAVFDELLRRSALAPQCLGSRYMIPGSPTPT